MEGKLNHLIHALVLLNACVFIHSSNNDQEKDVPGLAGKPGGSTIDVGQLGGKPGSDIAPAFKQAWKQACESTTAVKIVVPKGNYSLTCMEFVGPCKAPITVEIAGNFQAPTSISQFKDKDPTWIKFDWVQDLTVKAVDGGGIFDGNGEEGWTTKGCSKETGLCVVKPYNFRYSNLNNTLIDGITSLDSKQFHNMIIGCQNLTIQNMKIIAPGDARNTDGVHIARSRDIKILNTPIKTGDDCISIGDGTENLLVEGVSCGPGHGISIGSLGKFDKEGPVTGITIKNCSFTNTDNGIRIKSWLNSKPCAASDMHFEEITMDNVSNPIFIDQAYCPSTNCDTSVPSKVRISEVFFKNIRGTGANPSVMRFVCSRGIPCNNIHVENVDLKYSGPLGEAVSECCNVKPVATGKVNPPLCGYKTSEEDSAKKVTFASIAASKVSQSATSNSQLKSQEASESKALSKPDSQDEAESVQKEAENS